MVLIQGQTTGCVQSDLGACCPLILPVTLRYLDPEDRTFNRVISDISVVLGESTLTISDSIEAGLPVGSKIVSGSH